MDNSVAVLIIFFNKLSQTIECIESFIASRQNIYVLNNGSDEKDWEILKETFNSNKQIIFFKSEKNLGACVGRNFLIQNSKEPWLLIVDNDVVMQQKESWHNQFLDFLRKQPDTEIVQLKILNKHENQYISPVKVVRNENRVTVEISKDYITNCFPCTGTIVNRRIFDTYGLFDPDIFVGLEEYEYTLRSMTSDGGEFKVYHLDSIELIHDHKFQKKQRDRDSVKERYDEEMLKNNFKVIESKYNIVFDHDWQWWSRKQVNTMTANKTVGKIKSRIGKWVGR
jgi:GT2 family glycosyltransferase